jgi:hypothetical protein
MNFIAGMLVLAMKPAAAFNVLVVIMDKYMPQKYYSATLENVVVDQQVFEMLVAEYLPKVIPIFCSWKPQGSCHVHPSVVRCFRLKLNVANALCSGA